VSVLVASVVAVVALAAEFVVAVDDVLVADVSVIAAVSPPVPVLLSFLHDVARRVATIRTRTSFRIAPPVDYFLELFA